MWCLNFVYKICGGYFFFCLFFYLNIGEEEKEK